ncbi:hypothetical protein [Flavobacterium sp. UBA7682]|uniref:hypothetical protein n=1 Tax=Flavobacterium sp. UBA7682 TaxID=1946560 RepID=UPI0025C1DFD5|nr:hypothetical protein [Flavobacterium sp. UBA7682]
MKIDIEKSISFKKLIYRKSLLDMFFYYFLVLCIPVLLFYVIITKNFSLNYKEIIFSIVIGIPFIWNLIGLKYIDELTYIGEIESQNRSEYLNGIKTQCKYEIVHDEVNLVIMKKDWSWDFSQAKELIIIFEGNKAYGNLTNLGRGDIRIPFFSYFNKIKLSKRKNYL